LQINADSGVNPDHLSYFHFVGRIIGVAIFHGHHIDAGFTTPFYKMMLGKTILLADIEAVDPEVNTPLAKRTFHSLIFQLHSSLSWLLENDISSGEDLDATFSVEHEAFGVVRTHELKPGGKDLRVDEANKREYVRLYVSYRWCRG